MIRSYVLPLELGGLFSPQSAANNPHIIRSHTPERRYLPATSETTWPEPYRSPLHDYCLIVPEFTLAASSQPSLTPAFRKYNLKSYSTPTLLPRKPPPFRPIPSWRSVFHPSLPLKFTLIHNTAWQRLPASSRSSRNTGRSSISICGRQHHGGHSSRPSVLIRCQLNVLGLRERQLT